MRHSLTEGIAKYIHENPLEFPRISRVRESEYPGKKGNLFVEMRDGTTVNMSIAHIREAAGGYIGKFLDIIQMLPEDSGHYDLTYMRSHIMELLVKLHDDAKRHKAEKRKLQEKLEAIDTTRDTLAKFAGEFTKAMKESQ